MTISHGRCHSENLRHQQGWKQWKRIAFRDVRRRPKKGHLSPEENESEMLLEVDNHCFPYWFPVLILIQISQMQSSSLVHGRDVKAPMYAQDHRWH